MKSNRLSENAPVTIEEKIRQIMLSEQLPDSEKLDRLHALIPLESFEIDDLSKATPTTQAIARWLSSHRRYATAQTHRVAGG